MASRKKVAVVGPNGTLGVPIVTHLLRNNISITLLTRDPRKSAGYFPDSSIRILEIDYTKPDLITSHLRGHSSVIILINRNDSKNQIKVIDAAIAAGVPHLVPSSFGLETYDSYMRSLPPLAAKIEMEDHLKEQADKGLITFTSLNTSMFFDWALAAGVFINPRGTTMLMDGGDAALSLTALDDIGKAIASIVQDPEKFKNRLLSVNSVVLTQNQCLKYAKEIRPDQVWPTVSFNTEDLERRSWEAINSGDTGPSAMRGLLARASWGKGYGLLKNVDNEALGVQLWDEEKIKRTLARFC